MNVRVTIIDPAGVIHGTLAVKQFGVSARQAYSFPPFAEEMGFSNMGESYVLIEPAVPNAAYVWATVIDRTFNDGTVVHPVRID